MAGIKIAFDFGTSTVLAAVHGRGVKIKEPSVIAYDTFDDRIIAIGRDAYRMIGKAPDSITVVRPVREGTVYDYDAVEHMLRHYIQKLCGNRIFKPEVIISVPAGVSELEKRTVAELATKSGASKACVIEEPLAAAIGAGVDIHDHTGVLIVDIGGGTTDLAIVTGGCIAVSSSLGVAGKTFDEDICRFARREKDTVIGDVTAESVKKQVGAAKFPDAELAVRAVGKDYLSKLPRSIEISSTDIFLCIREHLEQIIEGIRLLLESTQPELNADILTNGIIVTGGGAGLRGIDEYIQNRLGLRTRCAEEPELCVVRGIDRAFSDRKILSDNGYVFKSYSDIKDFEE